MDYCQDCGELTDECTCPDHERLEYELGDPDVVPELNFDAGY